MMKSLKLLFAIILAFGNMTCSQNRTYLTEQEKEWNPYKAGSRLIFGTEDGRNDTITVTMVEGGRFPDGLGAETNERLRVLANLDNQSIAREPVEMRLLYIIAKTPKDPSKLDFEFSVGDGIFWAKPFPIEELDEYNENYLELSYRTFNDVIRVDDNSNQVLRANDITTIYWSKSVGYVKCEKKDGTVWELINIIDSP